MQFLALLEPILKLLKDAGIIRDPGEEAKVRQQMADIAARQEEAFVEFIKATTPSADRVYVIANTFIALVRPVLAVFTALTLIFYTDRWLKILNVLKDAGIWGAIGISPLLVWVLGRDGLRMVLGIIGTVKNGGKIPEEVLPTTIPKPARPFTSDTGFSKERSERL